MFSSRPGTKITFFGAPSRKRAIPASACASAIAGLLRDVARRADLAAHLAVHLHRDLDLVHGRERGVVASASRARRRCPRARSSSHSSSAMCGAKGATSCTSGSTSARCAERSLARSTFMYSIIAAIAVL